MSGPKNRRKLQRIDYKKFHETGEKVEKNMAFNEEITLEAKLVEDIDDFFIMFSLNEMVSDDEISEGLEKATISSKKYRDVHTELRIGMKDEYGESYPEREKFVEKLREYVKEARKKVRELKERREADKKEDDKLERMYEKDERKVTLEYEHNFFLAKIERKLTAFDLGHASDYNEITTGINVFEGFLDEWYALNGKLKGLFGEMYLLKYEGKFHEVLEDISQKIENGKLRLKEIIQAHEVNTRKTEEQRVRVEHEKLSAEKVRLQNEQKIKGEERKFCTKNLYDEIILLASNLRSSCQIEMTDIVCIKRDIG